MIARIWRGVTLASKADDYLRYLEETGLKEYRATPGNQGVWVLRRTEGDRTEFLLISLWDSFEAIRRFAGDEIENAVFYPEDDLYLLERGPKVTHHELKMY
jgi:heme-degrading monooxygenase HmoA